MNKKLLLMSLALAGGTFVMNAQTRVVIVPSDESAPEKAFGIKDVAVIKFGEAGFTVENVDGSSAPFTFLQVGQIKFDDKTTGVTNATRNADALLKLHYSNGMLGVDGLSDGRTVNAVVCDMNGRMVMRIENWNGSPVSTNLLAGGVYTFTVNNTTIKFTK